MKKNILCTLLMLLLTAAAVNAQSPVRVKCNHFTMDVPSANVSCYQVEGNIPVADDAAPEEIARAQVANSNILISDFERGGHTFSPRVTIYAQADLVQTSLSFLEQVSMLSDVLENVRSGYAELQNVGENVPFLPYQTASRLGNALPKLLDFENGSGIRLVTAFSNASGSADMVYSFQGITTDRQYYISAVIPLRSDILDPASIDWNSLQESSLSPSLETLDTYMQSIVIEY